MLSVIIPAHNEEAVIGRCLSALTAGPVAAELDIVVAANGCTDRTLDVVSRFPGVRALESAVASKHAALNAGDAAARWFPRAYVDADVEVSADALVAVARQLCVGGPLVGAPALRMDFTRCSWGVRSFYRVWLLLDWSTAAPVGSGVYVLSAEGHARLDRFPDIISDDQYIHDLFVPAERVCLAEHRFVVRPAQTLRALLRRRTRELEGQAEFEARFGGLPGRAAGPSVLGLLRAHPKRVADVALVAAVKVAATGRLRWKRRQGTTAWERDETSRVSGGLEAP